MTLLGIWLSVRGALKNNYNKVKMAGMFLDSEESYYNSTRKQINIKKPAISISDKNYNTTSL